MTETARLPFGGVFPLSYLTSDRILTSPILSPPSSLSWDGGAGTPIFLSGCNRGGTTLVTRLLAAHPEVVDIGTGQFDEGQYIWRQKFPDWSRHRWAIPPWRWFMRRTGTEMRERDLEFFRDAFRSAWAAAGSRGRMLEKTPANAVRIPLINRLYPRCRFVHVIRDGRDTSASLIARKVAWWLAPHQWVGAHSTALPDLERLPSQRVTFVRYETLIADPEVALRDLCHGCNLEWGRREADLLCEAARVLIQPPERRWERLPCYQRCHLLRVIGPLQQELGYPVEM